MILPLVGLLTIIVLSLSTEVIARQVFPVSDTLGGCLVFDATTGVRGIPNSSCWYRRAEHPLTEYRFNNCGHLTETACDSLKPAGTYRIVMVGSSYGMGLGVARNETFAVRLPMALSQRLGRKVELYNESMYWGTPLSVTLRFKEVLAAKPDAILWELTPWDIGHVSDLGLAAANEEKAPDSSRYAQAARALSTAYRVITTFGRTSLVIRNLLFRSQSQYINAYLLTPDSESGFLKSDLSVFWKTRLRQFDLYAADITKQASAAGVPVVVVMLPNRALAAIISRGEWPSGIDPDRFNRELRSIVEHHGGTYIDILPDFQSIPNPEQHYYPVDDHPDASGHAILARLLERKLTSGVVPELRSGNPAQPVAGNGN